MGGLAILLIIAAYIGVASVLAYKIKPRKWKVVAIVVAVLLPTADAVVGRFYLTHLCAKEGGLKVYRVAEKVEGFMEERATTDYWVKQHGYQFTEGNYPGGKVHRVSLQDGKVVWEENVTSRSQYRLRLVFEGRVNVYVKDRYLVEAIASGETLASSTQIGFRGGWAERFVAGFSDAGVGTVARCDDVLQYPESRSKNLVLKSLKH